ncbi:MAG: double-strand break repair protein AddB [Caulobacteraceae bacterium]
MTAILDAPGPRWFTIPSHRPFLGDLAAGLWRALCPLGPEALAEAVILIPTRRSARALAEAFLGAGDHGAVLLPQIRALGDLDEGEAPFEPGDIAVDLPPAIGTARRRFELAGLIVEHEEILERRLDAGAALEMADALAAFLDGCALEEVGDRGAVQALVDGELARHWQVSADFLGIALAAWPRRLEALGLMDVATRRVALLRRLAARWRDRPPAGVIVAAGSTGTAPAAADLLATIARVPRGCVVLPGLDTSLSDAAWAEVGEQHPQGAMKRLLARAGLARGDVRDWDPAAEAGGAGRWRRRILSEALAPPGATADWLDQIERLRAEGVVAGVDPFAAGLAGLSTITAAGEEEAAAAIALLLREALETPGKTAALITPDAALARRVSARLLRWNISADSSAGQALAGTPAAVLAGLVARATVDPVDPVTLLAILKHPLVRLGLDEADLARDRSTLEGRALRGARPANRAAIEARLTSNESLSHSLAAAAGACLAKLHQALALAAAPFCDGTASAAAAASAVAAAMETLATGPRGGAGEPWGGLAGGALAQLFSTLIGESEGLPPVTAEGFSELLAGLMAAELVRSGGASHPRLRILGVLEARLLGADRLILAGLEEGVWPRAAPVDPFLSRPMRERLGLPAPERRIGLSAHDFAQAAAGPEVILVNAERRAGAPAVASRWLWRLRVLARGAEVDVPGRDDILAWARTLDGPLDPAPETLRTAPRPRPTPPVAARPRRLSVTAVETWVRDPYAVYARHVLGLNALERPDEPVEARARGSAVHRAFETFADRHPAELPAEAEAEFAAMLIQALREAGMPEGRMARERALAANTAPWAIDLERRRRPGARLIVEKRGELAFVVEGRPFTLSAKADRIEVFADRAHILDFKTGIPPTAKQVRAGYAPQLTLTGAIVAAGGFADIGPLPPGDLVYVRVSGRRPPGKEICHVAAGESAAMARAALDGLKRRVAQFDDPATPYLSWVAPELGGRHGGDYDQLARVWEWRVIGQTDGEPRG